MATTDFEKTFSDLAYAFLQQSGLPLMKYLLGFEVVDKSEDDNKAVGFFAFKINDNYYYVPVFFNNSEIKPLLLIYSYGEDMFYPLTDEWVNFITKSESPDLGKGIKEKPKNLYPLNLRQFIYPPFINKYSEYKPKFQDFLKKATNEFKYKFAKVLKENRTILEKIAENYPLEDIIKSCSPKQNGNVKKQASVRLVEKWEDAASLSEIDKIRFMKFGFSIADDRKPWEWVPAYNIEFKGGHETSPKETGIYPIITSNGIKDCLVSISPFSLDKDARYKKVTVVDIENRVYTKTLLNLITVADRDEHPRNLMEKMKFIPVLEMEVGKRYILYDPNSTKKTGCFSEEFDVRNKTKGQDGNVYYSVYEPDCDEFTTIIIKSNGRATRMRSDLLIPQYWSAFELKDNSLQILGEPQVQHYIYEDLVHLHVPQLALYNNEKFIEKFSSEKDAVYKLASKYRLGVADAFDMVYNKRDLFVKRSAYDFGSLGFMPSTYNITESGKAVQEPEYYEYPIRDRIMSQMPPVRTEYKQIRDDIDTAISLSELGVPEVFDQSLIGLLSKLSGIGDEIKSYIPDMTNSLDKLGRILFFMWSKGNELKDSFDVTEFSRFENLLKDTFRNFGEIVLMLKQKYFNSGIMPELIASPEAKQ